MKAEAVGKYYIVNGSLEPTKNTDIFKKIDKPPIYEVLRVIDGVALFLEDHLNRMILSASVVEHTINRELGEIEQDIISLITKNQIKNQNIKLLFTEIEGIGQVFLIYFIESFYPGKDYYEEGINTILFHHERENPNAKIQMTNFRKKVGKELEKRKAFEAMLVNRAGYILEGSRSNIFFVRGDKIYTGPGENVLLGITRKYIFEAAQDLNIKIIEENVHVDDLEKIQGSFMSGTSVNILPISKVDNIVFDSVNNDIIKSVNKAYEDSMRRYIAMKNKDWQEF